MTHKDIYTKFMIEYDKNNVASSYPSLTQYEVATILDKAYNALIAQKVTGNNPRRVPFEADTKAISDLHPLVKRTRLTFKEQTQEGDDWTTMNVAELSLPEDFMYYVRMMIWYNTYDSTNDRVEENKVHQPSPVAFVGADDNPWVNTKEEGYTTDAEQALDPEDFGDFINWRDLYWATSPEEVINTNLMIADNTDGKPYDKRQLRLLPVKLVSHEVAEKFIATAYNMPWVKNPVCYIYGNDIDVVYDSIRKPEVEPNKSFAWFVYICKPAKFVSGDSTDFSENTNFELSDTMAEELINLAVSFALENVEQQRLNTKLNMRGLES